MQDFSSFPFNQRPIVALFGEPNAITLSLVEILLANSCRVRFFSENLKDTRQNLGHLVGNKSLELFDEEDVRSFDYCISVQTKIVLSEEDEERLRLILQRSSIKKARVLFVTPSLTKSDLPNGLSQFIKTNMQDQRNLGIIYFGELLGPRINLNEEGYVPHLIGEALTENKITTPRTNLDLLYVSAPDLAREVARELFSFGPFGSEVTIGEKISLVDFVSRLEKFFPSLEKKGGLEISYNYHATSRVLKGRNSLDRALAQTINWFLRFPPKDFTKGPYGKRVAQVGKVVTRPRNFKPIYLLYALLVLLIPVFSLVISFGIFGLGFLQLKSGNTEVSSAAFSVSHLGASLAEKYFWLLSEIPFTNELFLPAVSSAVGLEKASLVGKRAVAISAISFNIAEGIFAGKEYEIEKYADKLYLELDSLKKDLGFLEGELKSSRSLFSLLLSEQFKESKLGEVREKAGYLSDLARQLPDVLGMNRPRTYLILFQNNMELRPTGGFIGSFALTTFYQGFLADIAVYDVYAADGQLEGHVEPPYPIKNYLGEANWYLRDANWDPDFGVSAEKIEWFLEKELNKEVEGVIGLDLEFVKGAIEATGPVFIPDYNLEITDKNFYEVTQTEVESGFFPGSQRKTSFLTALTRQFMLVFSKVERKSYLPLVASLLEGLEKKDLQIFLHDRKAQEAVSGLGWDGAVTYPVCEGNCYPDWLGVVEANVGVNKANYYIERDMDLSVEVGEKAEVIKRKLTVTYKNKADVSTGPSGRYKVYVRVITPIASSFNKVAVTAGGNTLFLDPETTETQGRKESGVLVEIPPGSQREITFFWQTTHGLDFDRNGSYLLYWRKQAGTLNDPVKIAVSFPDSSLTQTMDASYNTILARDFFSRISW